MSKKFAEYSKFDLSNVNKEVLKKWQDGDIFHKSLEIREGYPSFVFYEGPPSANGMPGIHHVIARSIKDIFCRYKTMKGFLVNRKAGWDTHGLPVELGVEKSMGITKEDIGKKISVADYNAACRRDVMKFTKEWEDLTDKMEDATWGTGILPVKAFVNELKRQHFNGLISIEYDDFKSDIQEIRNSLEFLRKYSK